MGCVMSSAARHWANSGIRYHEHESNLLSHLLARAVARLSVHIMSLKRALRTEVLQSWHGRVLHSTLAALVILLFDVDVTNPIDPAS